MRIAEIEFEDLGADLTSGVKIINSRNVKSHKWIEMKCFIDQKTYENNVLPFKVVCCYGGLNLIEKTCIITRSSKYVIFIQKFCVDVPLKYSIDPSIKLVCQQSNFYNGKIYNYYDTFLLK